MFCTGIVKLWTFYLKDGTMPFYLTYVDRN
jgi:hypothetical protein